jgi:hypothetical protein
VNYSLAERAENAEKVCLALRKMFKSPPPSHSCAWEYGPPLEVWDRYCEWEKRLGRLYPDKMQKETGT